MYVIKRDGTQQRVQFDKIAERIKNVAFLDGQRPLNINIPWITKQVITCLNPSVNKADTIDSILVEMLIWHASEDGNDYTSCASRLLITTIHKTVKSHKFSTNLKKQIEENLIDPKFKFILEDAEKREKIDNAIVAERDYNLDYFAIETLSDHYLLRSNGQLLETPQQFWMRVSLGIHGCDSVLDAIQTYHLLSQQYFIHGAATLRNAATPKPQLSSSYLLSMKDDSLECIFDTIKQSALLSQESCDVALSIHNIGCKGRPDSGGAISDGIVPMLRVINSTAQFLEQDSFSIYLECWHADIFDYLKLKKHGKEEERCHDLMYALWVPDLFMQRVKDDGVWSLMNILKCVGLNAANGKDFDELYTKYEAQKMYETQVKARELWSVILHAQMETGMPFIMYKDSFNRKSNQRHLGTLQMPQYCDPDEIAVSNMASISLPRFVDKEKKTFDFEKLIFVSGIITDNLNKLMDPLDRHKAIAISVDGLADVFISLRIVFDSPHAKRLNKKIFESIYYGAVKKSNELAMKYGAYETFKGSPASEGRLQFDMWENIDTEYNWDKLKKSIKIYGLRNSLLTVPMIDASTSKIFGNNEGFAPYATNVSVRETDKGQFAVINKHLLHDLMALGIWNDDVKKQLLSDNGSVQLIDEIPDDLKALYKTAFEIKQRQIINMAADRAPFIDQSQSMDIHLEDVSYAKLTSMHFYGWQKGLKTGMRHLRTKFAGDSIDFNIFGNLMPKDVNVFSPQKKQRNNTEREEVKPRKIQWHDDEKDEEEELHDDDVRYDLDHDHKEEESNKMLGNKLNDDDQKENVMHYKTKNKEDALLYGS